MIPSLSTNSCLPFTPNIWWPDLLAPGFGGPAGVYADFSEDVTTYITDPNTGAVDPITALSFAAMPSGAGEVAPSRLDLTTTTANVAAMVTVWLTGGVPGRVYLYQLDITTTAGRVLPLYIGQVCSPLLAANPVPVSPVPGFGTPLSWP
jgi:hypothetical protein